MAAVLQVPLWPIPLVAGFAAGLLASVFLARRKGNRRSPQQRAVEAFRDTRLDPLTRLANRQSFNDALATQLSSGAPLALLIVDLDGFAALNAAHGQRAADETLVAVADRLRRLTPDLHRLARLGGDEFAILLDLSHGTDVHAAELAAMGVLHAMTVPLNAGQQPIRCSLSIGAALAPAHGSNADALLTAARSALVQIKEGGGDGWRIFDPGRAQAERMRDQLKEELRVGVAERQILPHYQPITDLASGEMIGLEVLARWSHPTRGLLMPDMFIPMAEEMQLSGLISQSLMRRVIADSRDWPPSLYFAFNVSPGQLRELIGMVRAPPVWPEGVLDPTRLEIEVTESAMIEDIDVAREVIGLLQARGTRVVLDDFGIGFSNFFHLRELPFDRIKIDRSFVTEIAHDRRAEACVRAMVALGRSLGVDMVAEGIETAEIAAFVAGLGCRFGQGFLYSEPVPASGVPGLLRQITSAMPAL